MFNKKLKNADYTTMKAHINGLSDHTGSKLSGYIDSSNAAVTYAGT